MARIAHDLVARPECLPFTAPGQYPLIVLPNTIIGRRSLGSHSSIVPQHPDDLVVVVAVRDGEDVPAVGRPLVDQAVPVELPAHHAADQRVVDAGVVVGEEDPRGACRPGARWPASSAPGRGPRTSRTRPRRRRPWATPAGAPMTSQNAALPAAVAMPDAGRAAVDVVRHVGRLDVPRQRADAAAPGLREQRMVGESLIGQQGLQGAGAAPEAQRVDRQHRDVGSDVIAPVAGRLEPAVQRLAQHHPQA